MNVPVMLCYAHRFNTVVVWMLGIGGSAATCKKEHMGMLVAGGMRRAVQPLLQQQQRAASLSGTES